MLRATDVIITTLTAMIVGHMTGYTFERRISAAPANLPNMRLFLKRYKSVCFTSDL